MEALKDVELAVRRGEIVALVGPNGAGKTTILRILATTVLPDGGRAEVAGHDVVRDAAAARRAIGLVLVEERAWYWRLSARHNLEFFGTLGGLRGRRRAERADELLRSVELEDAADRPVGTFSAGMRARLALARALLHDPVVLLLDEPSHHLDPAGAHDLRTRLRSLARRRGTACLLASHDLHEVVDLADRVVGLVRGRVAFTRTSTASAEELEQAILAASR